MNRRVRTPTILQMEAVECGAASLAIVLAYHGKHVPLEQLRAECEVTRDGSNAYKLVQAAESHGLAAAGYSLSSEEIREIALPAIVFWEFNHFLVLEGFGRDRVYVNDPACGRRVLTRQEFNRGFTGVAIELEPGERFERSGRRPSAFSLLRRWAASAGRAAPFLGLTGLLLVLPGLAIPAFSKILVDEVLVQGMRHWLGGLVAGMAITAILRAGLHWLEQHHLLRLEQALAIRSSTQLFWHLLRLPINFYTQRYSAEMASRLSLAAELGRFLGRNFSTALVALVLIGIFAVVMAAIDVPMTLAVLAFAAVEAGLLVLVSGQIRNRKIRHLQEYGKLLGRTTAAFQTLESLKASGREPDFLVRYAAQHASTLNAEQSLALWQSAILAVPGVISGCCTAFLLLFGGMSVMDGDMSVGTLVAFQSLASSLLRPVEDLVRQAAVLQEMNAASQRIDDVTNQPADGRFGGQDATDVGRDGLGGVLELEDVTFGYGSRDSPIVSGISLRVDPGRRVCLVGPSGSGKSSVARLAAGLVPPWSGEVRVGGVPIRDLPSEALAGVMAIVEQETTLFEGTVRQNLTLWDATLSEAALVSACRDAAVLDVVLSKPGGFEHVLREGASDLSGGERQRLELARALATAPAILVLDEATSALDPETEREVLDALRRRGCAVLMAAHRASAIRDCDEVILLERGRVVGRGSPERLLAESEAFRRILEAG